MRCQWKDTILMAEDVAIKNGSPQPPFTLLVSESMYKEIIKELGSDEFSNTVIRKEQ